MEVNIEITIDKQSLERTEHSNGVSDATIQFCKDAVDAPWYVGFLAYTAFAITMFSAFGVILSILYLFTPCTARSPDVTYLRWGFSIAWACLITMSVNLLLLPLSDNLGSNCLCGFHSRHTGVSFCITFVLTVMVLFPLALFIWGKLI